MRRQKEVIVVYKFRVSECTDWFDNEEVSIIQS